MKRALPVTLLIIFYCIFAFCTYKDFGITADEFSSYMSGQIWLEYFQNKPITNNLVRYNPLINEHYRIYPMVLFFLVGSLKYEIYHLLNMLFFIPVLLAAGLLTLNFTKKWYFTPIPIFFILFSPRIIGDVANNPKDIPFAVAYFVSIALIFGSQLYKKQINYNLIVIILGLFFGYSQSIRPIGFGLYIVYFVWTFYNSKRTRQDFTNTTFEVINIFLIGLLFMAGTWPAIGANFAANFKKYISLGVDFNLWEGTVIYMGQTYSAQNLPWHYLFVWLGITLPLSHIVFILCGLYFLLKRRVSKLQIFLNLVVFLNVILYLVLKPNLYNGIRHYDFLIVILSFLAGLNLITILEQTNKKYFLSIVAGTVGYFVVTCVTIIKLHPYQSIYFNELVRQNLRHDQNFDIDYWGASYKDAAEYLKTNKLAQTPVSVYSCGSRTALDYYLGNAIVQKKNPAEADYIICDVKEFKQINTSHKVLTTVEKMGIPLIVIAGQ